MQSKQINKKSPQKTLLASILQHYHYVHFLRQLWIALDSVKLNVLVHHSIDPFFAKSKHTDISQTEIQCFDNVKLNLTQSCNKNKFSLPRALKNKKLSLVTLKTYCITIIFLRIFGASSTALVNSDYAKATSIFNNKMICKIESFHIFVEFLFNYANASFNTNSFIDTVNFYCDKASNLHHKLDQKILNLQSTVAHLKPQTQDIPYNLWNCTTTYCPYPEKSEHSLAHSTLIQSRVQ